MCTNPHDRTLDLEHRGLWEGLDGGRVDVPLVGAWIGVTGEDLRGLGVDVTARHGGGVGATAGVKVERQSRVCFEKQLTLSRRQTAPHTPAALGAVSQMLKHGL